MEEILNFLVQNVFSKNLLKEEFEIMQLIIEYFKNNVNVVSGLLTYLLSYSMQQPLS
jgi:hypothetical protein